MKRKTKTSATEEVNTYKNTLERCSTCFYNPDNCETQDKNNCVKYAPKTYDFGRRKVVFDK